jgi:DNA polymerase-3 subunit delta'
MLFYRYILLNFACKILDYLIFLYLCFMQFSEILGKNILKSFDKSADLGRIPHAQLFVGPEGGYVTYGDRLCQYILCGNQNGENNGANQSCNLKFQKYHILIYTLSTLL